MPPITRLMLSTTLLYSSKLAKPFFFAIAVELRHHLGVRRSVFGQLVGDRVHLLLRDDHAVDLLLGQRDLLELRRLLLAGLRSGGLLLGLCQCAVGGEGCERGRAAGNGQGGGKRANELTHGNLLEGGACSLQAELRTNFEMNEP